MAQINNSDLNNLRDSLSNLNKDLVLINQDVYSKIGGNGGSVQVSSVVMNTSTTDEQEVAEYLEDISSNLAWLTDTANALFSIANISLTTEATEDLTVIESPPEDVDDEKQTS